MASRQEQEHYIELIRNNDPSTRVWNWGPIGPRFSAQQVQDFIQAVNASTVLKSLNISGWYQNEDTSFSILRGLEQNTNLETLTMRRYFRDITPPRTFDQERVTVAVTNLMDRNTTLTNLDLGYNDSVVAVAAARALRRNTTLRSLSLRYTTRAENDGLVTAFADAISMNTMLTSLHIDGNRIGEDGVRIARAIETNTTLTELNLNGNQLTEEVGQALVRALDTNTTLVLLRINAYYPSIFIEDQNLFELYTKERIEDILEGRELPAVYDGPIVKAAVAPMPRGVKRKPSDLHLLLL